MKSASEWETIRMESIADNMIPTLSEESWIKQIQLDAIKEGMTIASDLVFAHGQKFSGKHQEDFHDATQAICTKRDTTSIP